MNKIEWIATQLVPESEFYQNNFQIIHESNYQEIANALNEKVLRANPNSRIDVYPIISKQILAGILLPDERLAIYERPKLLDDIEMAISLKDYQSLGIHLQTCSSLLSENTITQLSAFLQLIPDPNWKDMTPLSLSEIAGFGLVFSHEITQAFNLI